MTSLVLELQKTSTDQSQDVVTLLRKSIMAASKLRLDNFRDWCNDEMNGYDHRSIPPYRIVRGQLKAHNPYNGWIPVIMEDLGAQDLLSQRAILSSRPFSPSISIS
jgi:hypothetical protein